MANSNESNVTELVTITRQTEAMKAPKSVNVPLLEKLDKASLLVLATFFLNNRIADVWFKTYFTELFKFSGTADLTPKQQEQKVVATCRTMLKKLKRNNSRKWQKTVDQYGLETADFILGKADVFGDINRANLKFDKGDSLQAQFKDDVKKRAKNIVHAQIDKDARSGIEYQKALVAERKKLLKSFEAGKWSESSCSKKTDFSSLRKSAEKAS